MARRTKNNGVGLAVVLFGGVVAAMAAIPKEFWIAIGVITAIAAVIWLVSSLSKSKPEPASGAGVPEIVVQFETQSTPRNPAPAWKEPRGRAIPPRWIPVGETIDVAGTAIPDGMLYFGSDLRSASGEIDPALIDPRHSVARGPVDLAVRQMDYWPSYATISPAARRAYLDWLATGRSNPATDLGYVFLFFYGLERRALIDAASETAAKSDLKLIESEVQRLLKIYDDSRSFRRYATSFLEYLFVKRAGDSLHEGKPPSSDCCGMSLALKIALGRMAIEGRPVPAEWALAWVQNDPRISSPKALQRCPAEFDKLFRSRYRAQFGDGIKLSVNRTKLQAAYRPASGGFAGQEFPLVLGDIPDITAVIAPAKRIDAIVEDCATALSAYSRFVGTHLDDAASLEGILLLPLTLWPESAQATMRALNERVGDGLRVMSLADLATSLGGGGSLTRDRLRALGHALEELRIGIEPDVLAGARTPKVEDRIVLFRTEPEDSSPRNAPVYQAAVVTLDLACSVATADGQAAASELRLLMKQIDGWAHLTVGQRKRLRARLRMAIDSPPTLASLKRKLDVVPTEGRRTIAHLLSTLAQADGTVSPSEVKLIEKIYKALGLDAQVVYSDLHAAAAGRTTGAPAPSPEAISGTQRGRGFSLDMARVEALQKETEEVSALLSKVFADETVVPVEEIEEREEATRVAVDGPLGLDPEHTVFLRLLITRSSWARQDLAEAAADMELMLDGALERINEAALDHLDEPLIEGDDPIDVLSNVLEKLPA